MGFFIFIALVLAWWALKEARTARNQSGDLARQILRLETELARLSRLSPGAEDRIAPGAPPVSAPMEPVRTAPVMAPNPPPIPPPIPPRELAVPHAAIPSAQAPKPARPKFEPVPQRAPVKTLPAIDWEQFMGAKLFAWIGGLALFLGFAFFVKYSFDRNLISPEARVAIGFICGLGLLGGGVRLRKKESYAVTSQTLCATGVVVLYACTYAAREFPFFGQGASFFVMSLITAVAFFLAVRMDAQVVAVLGILGGFITPVVLSSGQDHPVGLFGYIALLDAGLIAVALSRRWNYLVSLGALGTAFMFSGWMGTYFHSHHYYEGDRVFLPMGILLGFVALFAAAVARAKSLGRTHQELSWSALGLSALGLLCGFVFLFYPSISSRPAVLFGFIFLLDAAVLAVAWLDEKRASAQPASGPLVFALLAAWTHFSLTPARLPVALGIYFIFTLFHSLAPLWLRRCGKLKGDAGWVNIFPALSLLLVLGPLFSDGAHSFLVWPFVLLVDVLAIGLAVVSVTLLPIFFVLLLTLAVTGASLAGIPAALTGLPTALFMLGGFSVFFLVASIWAARRLGAASAGTREEEASRSIFGKASTPEGLAALLPVFSVVLPFLLLLMVNERLPLSDPLPIFLLALILGALVLGVSRWLKAPALPLAGLASTVALALGWHSKHFEPLNPTTVGLEWYLAFYALFGGWAFAFRSDRRDTLGWASAALSGPLFFYVILDVVKNVWPQLPPGLVPAAFALPALLGLRYLAKQTPREEIHSSAALALFGGVTLFFVTLIFPIQFDREWITIGWALEGAALCWLFHRIAHPGLRAVGVGLLGFSFLRLALNPAVLGYHARGDAAFFNWYLYAYGIVAACLFCGARLLAPPRHMVLGSNTPPLLYALGTTLVFLLLNIEIADFFTAPGARVLTLEFSGNLGRDMTYSIAWGLFALGLLVIGIAKNVASIRRAGLGLLAVTLAKLFLHDLSQLDALYRIGALMAVAVIAIVASVLYQRFMAGMVKSSAREKGGSCETDDAIPDRDGGA